MAKDKENQGAESDSHEDPIDEMAHAMGEPVSRDDEPPPVKVLRRLDGGIGVLEQVAVAASLAFLIGISAYKGISAQFLDHDPGWTKHLIWYSLFLVAMSSAALSVQSQQIIKMDFLTRKVSRRTRVLLRITCNVFALVVLFFLIYQSWEAREGYKDTDEFLDDRLIAMTLPLAGLLIAIHLFLHSIIDGIYLSRGELPPEVDEPTGH